ncbi:hypothetical protein BGZ74_004569 [Mortierella antarctica]|nr:hypothetical protein BGZ74_004569 [Mortierella antarctica]
MFAQQSQPTRLQFPTNYHVQQLNKSKLQQQHAMAIPLHFPAGHHPNNNNSSNNNGGAPNSLIGTIDPGLLQMGMVHGMSIFPSSSSASSINSLSNGSLLRGLGSKRSSSNSTNNMAIKQEAASPDFLAQEMDFGEPGNMVSPGSTSPLGSPSNDFDSPDDFHGSNNNGSLNLSSHGKPVPLNIHQGSYGDSPGNGSLYSPGLESDFFPEGDFSLPNSRPLDMKFGRHMHSGSMPNPFHSMSMPVPRSDWFGATDGHAVGSFENPSGMQFPTGEMTMMSSLFEDEGDHK